MLRAPQQAGTTCARAARRSGSSGTRSFATAAATAPSTADLAGRTFLVTGATDGIGQHTALRLARAGADVLVHGRSPERVRAAVARVEAAAAGGTVRSYVADLASLSEVRQLAAAVAADHPDGIHTLINNAGVYCEWDRTGC
jgi:NAD(P)-dependent dehydrogenase (short-subunit alcohol dehydrogenase family)